MDVGTAYGRPQGSTLPELSKVGPGTPYGEVLRRYWQPVALTSDATTTPKRLKILGEDLILFRTKSGRAGLLAPDCAHRGASLYYGGVEDDGIRCCYHGWLFDPEGRCLEQPCEPDNGRHRDRVRQPWYPVREYHGLLFAYLGPPDRKPAFPVYDVLDDDSFGTIIADDNSFGGGGPAELDFNWLYHWENVLDPFHVPILHARFSGTQFVPAMAILPECKFEYTQVGVRVRSFRQLTEREQLDRVTEVVFPNIRLVASPKLTAAGPARFVGWVVPFDDTNCKVFTLARVDHPDALTEERSRVGGKLWHELGEAEHRRYPGDYEAQKSQGDVASRSREFLTTTDQGVTMLRRMMAKQAKLVAEGGDPAGVVLHPDSGDTVSFRIEAGNYISVRDEPANAPAR
ncbi:phenoxybenzoate dioxygenase [Prauserella marina]|uniref:Rieske [2Fe-2S] domain-containing protein n=1 Tax=Prauserella marina TaxID=530584 RepID=A0A222VKW0_9PSEU|nr:aromatic ring-hydroxylating dioxygenase subunit alpha [Prauserella marina]ASR34569.1 phenoxybenzoate dioxygenase [Prauserella marina]PWV85809.1 Rieske-like 2Fe-2S protein [Prauserella marina]SDC44971.1 Rieske [2Fe-2S] domain-containing protein [Prauserella marina]